MSVLGSNVNVIGNKHNEEDTKVTLFAKAYSSEKHIHTQSFVYPERANPIVVTKAAGAWADYPATKTTIIAAGVMSLPFDLHWIQISALSALGNYIVNFYKGAEGAEVLIGQVPAIRTAIGGIEGSYPITTDIIPAGTRISTAISSSNAGEDTLQIKVQGHVY